MTYKVFNGKLNPAESISAGSRKDELHDRCSYGDLA